MLRKVSDNANMKGSEPEWANQKQITSQVSYLQMLDIHVSCGRYTLEMLATYSVRVFMYLGTHLVKDTVGVNKTFPYRNRTTCVVRC